MRSFILGCFVAMTLLAVSQLVAAPYNLTQNGNATLARPCSHLGRNMATVAATAATTNRSGAIAPGQQLMVTCDVDVHMLQGASGVTGDTTNGTVLWDHVPYWFVSEPSGQYFAFTKKSGESDGSCYVTECR